MMMRIIPDPINFDWDVWNQIKNLVKHQVENKECEEVFFNKPIILEEDVTHSTTKKRFKILGITNKDRQLVVIFTVRNNMIRVISARDQGKKEKLQFNKFKDD